VILGSVELGYSLYSAFQNGGAFSVPIAGSGVIFLTSALILISSGAVAELVYNLGDVRESDFSRLTQQIRKPPSVGA
jgi:hypothetical protein